MNTIAILTKLFPKSVAAIQQQAINDYRESNEDTYPWPESDQDEPWIDEDHDRLAWEEEQHQEYIANLRAIAAKDLIAKYPEYYKEYLAETLNLDPCNMDFEDYVEHRQQLEWQEKERIAEIEAAKEKETKRVKELSAFIGKFCGSDGLSIDLNLLEAGDRIHLHSKRGVYTVVRKRDDYITLTAGTLQGKMFVVPIADVKCFYDHNKTMVRKLLKP